MPNSADKPTVKQQREAQRAAKVAALKKKQATEKRNRLIGILSAVVGGVAVLALIVAIVVMNPAKTPTTGEDPVAQDRNSIEIEGLETFDALTATHVEGAVEYAMTPPAGGDHAAAWLNCGVYSEPQANENAVHSLEHGAVWVTYDPEQVDGAGLETLRAALPSTYIVLSPFEGLPAPVVASAWGAQVQLDGPDDERLESFLQKYWKSPAAPEPGALCTGAVTGPGKVG